MTEVKEIDILDLLSNMLKEEYCPEVAFLLDQYKNEKTPVTRVVSRVRVTEQATQKRYEINIIKKKNI